MFAENFSVDVSTNPYPYQMCARYAWLYSWFEIFRWLRLHPFDGFATRNFAFAASCPGNVRQKIQFLNKFHFNLTIFVLLVFHFAVHPVAQGKLFLLQPSRAHNNCITSFRSFRKRARFYVFLWELLGTCFGCSFCANTWNQFWWRKKHDKCMCLWCVRCERANVNGLSTEHTHIHKPNAVHFGGFDIQNEPFNNKSSWMEGTGSSNDADEWLITYFGQQFRRDARKNQRFWCIY